MRLVLGVLDVRYSDASGGSTTTGDVAETLEQRYAVMATFVATYQDKIAGYLADSIANAIEVYTKTGGAIDTSGRTSSAMHQVAGQRRTVSGEQSGSFTFEADQKIEADFRAFLFGGEAERVKGATISAAAQAGKTKRTKSGYTKGKKPRPAFVDTGLYASSFRAWTEE